MGYFAKCNISRSEPNVLWLHCMYWWISISIGEAFIKTFMTVEHATTSWYSAVGTTTEKDTNYHKEDTTTANEFWKYPVHVNERMTTIEIGRKIWSLNICCKQYLGSINLKHIGINKKLTRTPFQESTLKVTHRLDAEKTLPMSSLAFLFDNLSAFGVSTFENERKKG